MTRVIITGGTGLIGRGLGLRLRERCYDVALLSRRKNPGAEIKTFYWDPAKGEVDREAVETADFVVHLAGANISGKRWSKKRRKEIVDSRAETAKLLFDKFKNTDNKLKAFISASGANYYGVLTSEKIFAENDSPGTGFMGETCRLWEEAANSFSNLGKRVAILRTGVVLSGKGGALPKMLTPVKLGVGSPVGSGRQYMPWIHIEDICNLYINAIENNDVEGPYNAVAPQHVTNEYFMKTLARVLDKPFRAPNVPGFVMKTLYGSMAEIILRGSRLSAEKIKSTGYEFHFPELEGALREELLKGE